MSGKTFIQNLIQKKRCKHDEIVQNLSQNLDTLENDFNLKIGKIAESFKNDFEKALNCVQEVEQNVQNQFDLDEFIPENEVHCIWYHVQNTSYDFLKKIINNFENDFNGLLKKNKQKHVELLKDSKGNLKDIGYASLHDLQKMIDKMINVWYFSLFWQIFINDIAFYF